MYTTVKGTNLSCGSFSCRRFSRSSLARLSQRLDRYLNLTTLQRVLSTHVPYIHHNDQGIQYAANDYIALLRQHEVQISMAEIGQVTQNGYVERLIRTNKEEEVYLTEYKRYSDAYS
jgi:putative transposase